MRQKTARTRAGIRARFSAKVAVLTTALILATAGIASAATIIYQYNHPTKSALCTLTGICKTITHCYPTNPYTTSNVRGCWYPHTDRK